MEQDKNRLERYKQEAKLYWDHQYLENSAVHVVHDAGGEDKTYSLAIREIDFFLYPTEEKSNELLNDKENNPFPTFCESFYQHPPISDFLDLKNSVCLDYGCGGLARYSIALSYHFKQVFGIDISSEAILNARRKVIERDIKNINLFSNNGLDIILPSNSIDFVFSNLVLQHIGNIDSNIYICKQFYKVLKKGGIVRLEYLCGKERKPDDFESPVEGNGIGTEELRKIYTKVGFEVLHISEGREYTWITARK